MEEGLNLTSIYLHFPFAFVISMVTCVFFQNGWNSSAKTSGEKYRFGDTKTCQKSGLGSPIAHSREKNKMQKIPKKSKCFILIFSKWNDWFSYSKSYLCFKFLPLYLSNKKIGGNTLKSKHSLLYWESILFKWDFFFDLAHFKKCLFCLNWTSIFV